MSSSTPERVSSFTSAAAGERFLSAYDRTLTAVWPVPVQRLDVPTSFGTVSALRHGPDGDDPYVLVGGAGGNAAGWYRFVEPLGRTRPVYALDTLGDPGRSVQTVPLTGPADVAGWLAEFLAGIGAQRAHVVGMSYGGWSALVQTLHRPGRVAAVTLLDPAGLGPVPGSFYRWVVLGGLAGLLPAPLRAAAARRLANGTLAEAELMRLVRASVAFRRRLPNPPVLTDDEFTAVPVPVQLLLGERSAMNNAPVVARRMRALVPGWRTEVLPGTGHAMAMDDPDAVLQRLLGFEPSRP